MNQKLTISTVLFDLDNTLIGIPNSMFYFNDILDNLLTQHYKIEIPSMEEKLKFWTSGKQFFSILKKWGISDSTDFWDLFDKYDYKLRKPMIDNRTLILYDDVVPFLTQLSENKIKMGIVSNSPTFILKEEIETYKIDHFFMEYMGLGDNQSICKPEPDGVNQILEKMNAIKEETILIGDSINDIKASHNSGITPFMIKRNNKGKASQELLDLRKKFMSEKNTVNKTNSNEKKYETIDGFPEIMNYINID